MSQHFQYFQSLATAYRNCLETLSPYWSDRHSLKTGLQRHRDEAIAILNTFQRPVLQEVSSRQGIGLNTVGLLTDRLTILTIKEWQLQYYHKNQIATQKLYDVEILDILEALANAAPAKGALNSKLTSHVSSPTAHTWTAAAYDLFATNILIWKAQDFLYNKSDDSEHELRNELGNDLERSLDLLHTYTIWLPKMNLRRDALIQRCEQIYWQSTLSSLDQGYTSDERKRK